MTDTEERLHLIAQRMLGYAEQCMLLLRRRDLIVIETRKDNMGRTCKAVGNITFTLPTFMLAVQAATGIYMRPNGLTDKGVLTSYESNLPDGTVIRYRVHLGAHVLLVYEKGYSLATQRIVL